MSGLPEKRCSFCFREAAQVEKLAVGVTANICCDCAVGVTKVLIGGKVNTVIPIMTPADIGHDSYPKKGAA